MSEEKKRREQLARLLLKRAPRFPLSPAQERIWFLSQLAPDSPVYNIPAAVRLRGPLDPAALSAALQAIVERHTVLRTIFEPGEDRPAQAIRPLTAVEIEVVDLRGEPEPESAAVVWANERTRRPFDLTEGCLLRAHLARTGADRHLLLLVMHHIASEVWSIAILFKELEELYAAQLERRAPELPRLPIQYADYAVWQREQEGDWAADLDYFRERLRGPLPVLDLPTDHPRTAVQEFDGAWRSHPWPPALARRIHDFGRSRGATLFMTMLASWAALLSRYSGQTDLAIGAPVAGRDRAETEGLIGMFINSLALRLDLRADPSLAELLGRVRTRVVEAFAHQAVPFERVVEAVEPVRDVSHTPVFQVMFTLQNTPLPELRLPEITASMCRPEEIHNGTTKVDLGLFIEETPDGFYAGAEYRTQLFEAETVDALLVNLRTLLEAGLDAPDTPISRLRCVPESQRERILSVGTGRRADGAPSSAVHEAFARHAAEAPHAPAVSAPDGALDYGGLDQAANRMARYLLDLGIGVESRVGVILPRRVDMVVARLAVLKVGAAYVSLDPFSPPGRSRYMLEDSQAPLVVADGQQAALLGPTSCRVLDVDRDADAWKDRSPAPMDIVVSSENLAYVIYTSGSTGRPKGVELSHRALMNLVLWHRRAFGISPADRGTQIAGLAFDASVWELWPYLTAGASIHIPDEESRAHPEKLRDWLLAERITVPFLATPLAEAMLELPWPEESDLRYVLTGGDRLHRPPPPGLPFTLVNNYGPTENAVVSTSTETPPRSPDGAEAAPPIGRAVDGTRVYVLDRHLSPVPFGVPGELFVAGDSLARGYLDRPGLTAERFLADPWGPPGSRMYRTGDLVRLARDGNVDFLGRNDFQVKIRGFRVELGEIEATLQSLPKVAEAVVVVDPGDGDPRLVAYVAPDDLDPGALRTALRDHVPGYMVPAVITTLARLPLSPSGKVDRSALPAPGPAPVAAKAVAPRTQLERTIAEVWCDVLGLPSVGTADSFFDIGGHSMLLVKVNARLARQLEREISMVAMFRYPTVAALARHLSGEDDRTPTVGREGRGGRDRLAAQRRRRRR